MFNIITDISNGDSKRIDELYTRPQSIIILMWNGLQNKKWYDRWNDAQKTETETKESREKALKMWGK